MKLRKQQKKLQARQSAHDEWADKAGPAKSRGRTRPGSMNPKK